MNLKSKTHWLFDMDGTLTCAMHDFDAMRAALSLPAGVPILEALANLDPEEAQIKRQQLDDMELDMASHATIQPGCIELLDQLAEAGASLGILTRNGKRIAEVTLAACALEHYFTDSTIVSRDCCAAKPDPAGVHLLLQRWQATPASAVMVGDYLFDLEAGRNAGVTTVHMDVSGTYAWPELTDVSVASLKELKDRIV